MLELGDQPRFGFETAHKDRSVGEFGADDLDSHLAPHRCLVGAVDDPEVAFPDQLT